MYDMRYRSLYYIIMNYINWQLMFICTIIFQTFFSKNMFFMTSSKWFVSYFYNYNKNLYNKFKFLKN